VVGCVADCAARPSWFPPNRKFDPKAKDRVCSSWRLGKGISSSFGEGRDLVNDTRAIEEYRMKFQKSCR
jgi:hypothetical protein